MDLTNIQDIQIFKGPQGTLYGRNATGGAILINTLAPSKTFTFNAEAGYARFDEFKLGAFVSGPISDSVSFSLAGNLRSSDGYYRNIDPAGSGKTVGDAAPIRQHAVRAKLEADLTPELTATLAFNYSLVNDPTTLLFPNQGLLPRSCRMSRLPPACRSGHRPRSDQEPGHQP